MMPQLKGSDTYRVIGEIGSLRLAPGKFGSSQAPDETKGPDGTPYRGS